MSAESHCCFLEAVDSVFFFIVRKSQKRENDGGLRSGVVMSKTARKFLCSIKNVLSKALNFSITQLDEQRKIPSFAFKISASIVCRVPREDVIGQSLHCLSICSPCDVDRKEMHRPFV